jgi:branched-chain amino acid transport system permease protein
LDSSIIWQLAASGLLIGGVYALISIGLTLIFGVMRIVNFAHGEFLMASMFAAYWIHELTGLTPYWSAPLIGLLMFGFGALTHRLIISRTLNSPMVVQIFATVGLGLAMQNLALVFFSGDYRTIRAAAAQAVVRFGPVQVSQSLVAAFGVAVVVSALLLAFVSWTYPGLAIRATVQNRVAARLYGINIERVHLWTFALGSGLVGLAGALISMTYPIYPSAGQNFGLASFVVVVLGGMGSMTGALVGGLLIGLVETVSGFLIGDDLKKAVYFVMFILVLTLRPTGLFGRRGSEEIGIK